MIWENLYWVDPFTPEVKSDHFYPSDPRREPETTTTPPLWREGKTSQTDLTPPLIDFQKTEPSDGERTWKPIYLVLKTTIVKKKTDVDN